MKAYEIGYCVCEKITIRKISPSDVFAKLRDIISKITLFEID